MTLEEKLKNLILTRYKSMREFTQIADIPYTTLDSILKRGVANSSIANIIKICDVLHLSVDALAEGEIVFKYEELEPAPVMEIADIINDTKAKLSHAEHLVIDGKIVDIELVEPILEALDIGYEMTKKKHAKTITKNITES